MPPYSSSLAQQEEYEETTMKLLENRTSTTIKVDYDHDNFHSNKLDPTAVGGMKRSRNEGNHLYFTSSIPSEAFSLHQEDSSSSFDTTETQYQQALPTISEGFVRFAPDTEVRPTTHLDDLTDKEKQDTWYDGDEYFHMRQEAKEAIRWHNTQAMRGTSDLTATGVIAKENARQTSMYIVMSEQQRQRQYNIQHGGEFAIAAVYANTTYYSMTKAIELAQQDAQEAQLYYQETPKGRLIQDFFSSLFKKNTSTNEQCFALFDPSQWFPSTSKNIVEDLS